jgi:purine nucleosidase
MIQLWRGHTENLPYLHDPLAVGAVIDPSFVKLAPKGIGIETQGEYTRGMTFNLTDSNWWNSNRIPTNAQVAGEVDHRRFVDFFMERLVGHHSL